jgi:beta-galactosidase
LHREKDFTRTQRPVVKLNLDSATPVCTGTFAPGGEVQEIKFSTPATGKYFCLQSLNAQDGKPYAAVAELDLLGADGKSISHDGWTIGYVDSEERAAEDGSAFVRQRDVQAVFVAGEFQFAADAEQPHAADLAGQRSFPPAI